MVAALVTTVVLSLAALSGALALGYAADSGPELLEHTTWGTFATLLVLLSHSLTMFYLIGKGRAVREAATEGQLSGQYAARIAELRRPVFTLATLAMALTMATAIIGAGVDTAVFPPPVHAWLGLAAVAAGAMAVRAEIVALVTSARITTEVNRRLGA